MNPRELWHLLQQVGLGAAVMAVQPSLWCPPLLGLKAAAAAANAVAAAKDTWVADTLAGLADGEGMLLNDGTVVGLGSISIAAEDLSFSTPVEDDLTCDFAAMLAGPPPGLPPDCGPEFELHINTGKAPMARSLLMKHFSEGEMEECSKQVAWLLDNC